MNQGQESTTYSRLMDALKKNNVGINRKVLADIAMHEPDVFKMIVGHVNS